GRAVNGHAYLFAPAMDQRHRNQKWNAPAVAERDSLGARPRSQQDHGCGKRFAYVSGYRPHIYGFGARAEPRRISSRAEARARPAGPVARPSVRLLEPAV